MTSLHYITLHYITLHYITLHYITLHYITLHYITLHYMEWNGMEWNGMEWSPPGLYECLREMAALKFYPRSCYTHRNYLCTLPGTYLLSPCDYDPFSGRTPRSLRVCHTYLTAISQTG
jgi:hypothetical protein